MNGMIAGAIAAKRGRPIAALAPTAAAEKLSGALDDLDRAQASGREDAIAYAEHVLDGVVHEAREARAAREQAGDDRPRDPETGQFVGSFDGGVSKRPFAGPTRTPPSASQLFAQAMSASRVERAGRGRPERLHMTIHG